MSTRGQGRGRGSCVSRGRGTQGASVQNLAGTNIHSLSAAPGRPGRGRGQPSAASGSSAASGYQSTGEILGTGSGPNVEMLPSGPHAGESFQMVSQSDPEYCQWVLAQDGLDQLEEGLQQFANFLKFQAEKQKDADALRAARLARFS
ncbi:unnamed protein product [Symbiodinium necroappetens]|uniref:Uncharacterized protein n=1 Tax=Symbiodinium necroappetens TaxID=1628268 RepID=A0A812RAR0_9DINO|nr:unnamed protein product [Symbiodinium necroappetens]